ERLRAVLDRLSDKQNVRVHFTGHTDNQPLSAPTREIYATNQGLSESRAATVARLFQAALSLSSDMIETRGYADTRPVASNATAAGMALNRRVEIEVTYDEVAAADDILTETVTAATDQMRVRVINRGIREEGIAGVRLATVEGLVIETDARGRYHIAGVDGGFFERGRNFIVKVDPASLPQSSEFTTENPRVKRITQGLMNQFDFGVRVPRLDAAQRDAATFEFSPSFFEAGETRVRARYAHLLDELVQTLRQTGGGRVVILGDDATSMRLLQKRARVVNRALRDALPDDVRRHVEVLVMAPETERPSVSDVPRESRLKRGIGALLSLFTVNAYAAPPCTLSDCVEDDVAVVRMRGNGPTARAPDAPETGRYRVGLPGGGVIWATEDAASVVPRLSVAGPESFVFDGRAPVTFLAYTNYGAFMESMTLTVYHEADRDRANPLAVLAPNTPPQAFSDFVYFQWDAPALPVSLDARLAYVLQVADAQGRRDETAPGFIQSVSQEQQAEIDEKDRARWDKHVARHGTLPVHLDNDGGLTDRQAHRRLALTYGRSQLVRQNIPLHGARVRLHGADIDPSLGLYVDGHRVPLDHEGQFAAEYLLPVGEHWAEFSIGNDALGYWMKDVPVSVTGNQTFLVALADFTASSSDLNGSLEPLSGNARYGEESLVEGRVAYYLKARIKGKYLLTSQLDSREQQLDDLLGSLDEKDTRNL
ncbi:MAG: OmpA family protein, partial [Pseudomonadota bacterium]